MWVRHCTELSNGGWCICHQVSNVWVLGWAWNLECGILHWLYKLCTGICIGYGHIGTVGLPGICASVSLFGWVCGGGEKWCFTVLCLPAACHISVNQFHLRKSARHRSKCKENTSDFASWSKKFAPLVVNLMPWWWWLRCGAVILGAMVLHAHAYQHGNSLAYRALLHLCQKMRMPKSRKEANPKKK